MLARDLIQERGDLFRVPRVTRSHQMKDEDQKSTSQKEGKPLDQEEQVAEAVELSYGRRVLGLGREGKLREANPDQSAGETKRSEPSN